VVTLLLSFKRVTTARNLLIDSHHYKRHKKHSDRISFTLTFHPHNHSVKSIILKNFELLQNDPETGTIFSQPPLISFKRDKSIGNFLVRSSFQANDQPGTFKCARARCKTCPFIHNANKISAPKLGFELKEYKGHRFMLFLQGCKRVLGTGSLRKEAITREIVVHIFFF